MYNPGGNGQCERYNGIIWSAVKLALKLRGLEISQWEGVLPNALHSIHRPDAGDVAAGPLPSDALTLDEDGRTESVTQDHTVPLRRSSRQQTPVQQYGAVPYS